jgi:hypothetical protein
MHCPYCGAQYSLEKPCFCQPPVQAKPAEDARSVQGPWGEAEQRWSEPGEKKDRVIG